MRCEWPHAGLLSKSRLFILTGVPEYISLPLLLSSNPQGDRELALGLQISPLSDRRNASSGGMSKSQTGFYEFIVLPLVYNMLHVFPEIRDGPLNGFRLAYLEWKARQQHLPAR